MAKKDPGMRAAICGVPIEAPNTHDARAAVLLGSYKIHLCTTLVNAHLVFSRVRVVGAGPSSSVQRLAYANVRTRFTRQIDAFRVRTRFGPRSNAFHTRSERVSVLVLTRFTRGANAFRSSFERVRTRNALYLASDGYCKREHGSEHRNRGQEVKLDIKGY